MTSFKKLEKWTDFIKFADEVAARLDVENNQKNSVAFFAQLFDGVKEEFKSQQLKEIMSSLELVYNKRLEEERKQDKNSKKKGAQTKINSKAVANQQLLKQTEELLEQEDYGDEGGEAFHREEIEYDFM